LPDRSDKIGVDQRLDRIDDGLGGEPAPDNLADGCVLVRRTAERDLVELLALLLQAENADMADMVMATGIDAAGNLDLQLADLRLTLSCAEAIGNA
jgi:hypothetical protein